MIDATLAAFLEEGIAIHLGTRNERLEPNGVRATAVKVEDDGTHVIVYVAGVASPYVMADLEANGEVAVVFARPVDDRACQVKGRVVDVRPAGEQERALVARQWDGFQQQLERIGISRTIMSGWTIWPSIAVRVRATALFEQTPRPGTGGPLVPQP